MLEIITFVLILIFTILLFFLYRFMNKINQIKSGVISQYLSHEKSKPLGSDYQMAYDLVYQHGSIPQPYDDCGKYNEWVRIANKRGKEIVDECVKVGLKDCPGNIPWLETKC